MTISYRVDDGDHKKAGEMISVPGRWVGVKNGVFCVRREEGEGGYLTVERVTYQR